MDCIPVFHAWVYFFGGMILGFFGVLGLILLTDKGPSSGESH